MGADQETESEILQLIRDALQERRKAELRLEAAQRAVEDWDRKVSAFKTTLDAYRTKYGLPKDDAALLDPKEVLQYQKLAPKDMLRKWAELHTGEVVMKDACQFLATAGLFKDATQAGGTLYSTIKRMAEFEQVARGVYRTQVATPEPEHVPGQLRPLPAAGQAS